MPTWKDELIEVLKELGGEGHLSAIATKIKQRRRKKFVASSVRSTLEIHCPQKCYSTGIPVFYHKGNERSGIYGLIDFDSVDASPIEPELELEPLDVQDYFEEDQLVAEIKSDQLRLKTNKDVEEKAIEIVTRALTMGGWTVKSVERERKGYDLLCRKENKTRIVEVKGRSGNEQEFIITKNELKQAKINPSSFYIFIITSTLSEEPSIYCYSGRRLLEEFDFEPLAYVATLKEIS